MATPIQKLTAIANALVPSEVATAGQITKLGNSFVYNASDEEIFTAFTKTKAQLTNSEIALFSLSKFRKVALESIARADVETQAAVDETNRKAIYTAAQGSLS